MNYRSIHVHKFCFSTPKAIMYIHYFLIPKKIKVLNNSILSPTLVSQCLPILWGNEHWNGNEETKVSRSTRSRAPKSHSLRPWIPNLTQTITF